MKGVVDRTQRPTVPLTHANETEHRRQIASRVNVALPMDGSGAMTAPLKLAAYAVADLPTASLWTQAVVYVSDETGGAVLAYSDGADWRRVTDRAVVS